MSTSAVSPAAAASAVPPAAKRNSAPKPAPTQTPRAAAPANTAAAAAVSSAAAALKEATETSSQTVREASSGDHQAQRLLAKETAQAAERRGSTGRARVSAPQSQTGASKPGSIINEKA